MKGIAAILAMFAVAWACCAAQAPRVLHSVKEVRMLSHADAARHLPVDAQATVTFFRGFENTLFVQDGDTAGFVWATTKLRLEPGDVIRIQGTTEDSFNPIIISSSLTVVGHGPMPAPVAATWADLESAKYDCRWVTVRGRVAVAEIGTDLGGGGLAHRAEPGRRHG